MTRIKRWFVMMTCTMMALLSLNLSAYAAEEGEAQQAEPQQERTEIPKRIQKNVEKCKIVLDNICMP